MVSKIAQDIAAMDDELNEALMRVRALEGQLGVVTAERDELRVQCALIKQDRDKHMVKATKVHAILQQAGMAITGGITAMQEDIRREQELALGVNNASTARFIRREVTKTHTEETMRRRSTTALTTQAPGRDPNPDTRLPNVSPVSEERMLRGLARDMGVEPEDKY